MNCKKLDFTKILKVLLLILALPFGEVVRRFDWVGFVLLIIFSFNIHAQTITRNPYLQQLNQNGVTIRWRTDVPTNSFVSFSRQDSSKIFTAKNAELSKEHMLQLTDLQPNTKYIYTVGTDTKTLATGNDFYFITAPNSTNNRPINIWAMGDFGDNSNELYTKNQVAVSDNYLKKKASYTDLWLWLGDNAYCCGTDVEYQKQIFDVYGSKIMGNTAFFPVPGNHEYFETATGQIDKKINYFEVITVPTKAEMGGIASNTKEYYSYNYGNIHFVALDSYGLDEGKYRFFDPLSKQYQWLVKDLTINKSLWTIIYFHHPPYTKRSHDSDAELELVQTREGLVPVFDKFKVDLVLSGHSHVYERSVLMKGHTGHSQTFDARLHSVQNANGRYDKNVGSKPYINKDEGTIYAVVGSAGRLDWNTDPNPHPSSAYSNYAIGGSLLLTINNNRLDGRWVCADGEIRDNFTVFKNVNKVEKIAINYGDEIPLNASWKGNYIWSNIALNKETIFVSPRKDSTISVRDSLGFLKDVFQISVSPQPIITTNLQDSTAICLKKELNVHFQVKNTSLEKWSYILELSDINGSFEKPLTLDKSNKSPFKVVLPDSLKESKNYRFRVRPNVDFFDTQPSKNFQVSRPATAKFIGENTFPFDTTITLNLRFEGTPPFTYKINNLPESISQNLETTIKVKQISGANYILEKVSNACGAGIVLAENKVNILAPLALEEEENKVFSIFPNPNHGDLIIENHSNKALKTQIVLRDLLGKRVIQKTVIIIEKEPFSLQELPSGTYLLTLKTADFKIVKKIVKM